MNKNEAIELYHQYKKYNIYNYDELGIEKLENQLAKDLKNLYNEKSGKTNKSIKKITDFLGESIVNELKKPYEKIIENEYKKRKEYKKNLFYKLFDFSVDYIPEKSDKQIILKKSYGGDYHTQGWGANKYAKQSLTKDQFLLTAFGYDVKINIITDTDKQYNTYELVGNITEFDFFMITLKGLKLSELDMCVLLWRAGVNPKVYNPFLSYDIFDKSLELMNDKNYQITFQS